MSSKGLQDCDRFSDFHFNELDSFEVFCRKFFNSDLINVLVIRLGLSVLERKTTEIEHHFHHIVSKDVIYVYTQHDLALLMLALITWLRQ